MKIKGAKQVHYDSGPNMTPLVDVVMVILIFLMLAGSFGATSHYLTSKSISSGGSAPIDPPPGTIPDEVIELQILPDPNYGFKLLSGDINSQGKVPERKWLIDQLTTKMDTYKAQQTPVDQLQVVLFPSANARYEHIALVYEAVLSAGFKKVAFRTA